MPDGGQAESRLVDFALGAVEELVVHIAVGHPVLEAEASGKGIGQRPLYKALVGLAIVGFHSYRDFTAQALTNIGRGGDNIDCAGHRILAEQGALRAAQDFNALQVHETGAILAATSHVDTVDIHAHGLFEALVVAGTDAAHVNVGVDRCRGDVQVRYIVGQGLHIGNACALQLVALYGGHRDRHVLQALSALLRGNNDFFQLLAVSQGGCREYGNGRYQWCLAKNQRHGVSLLLAIMRIISAGYGWQLSSLKSKVFVGAGIPLDEHCNPESAAIGNLFMFKISYIKVI